MSLDCVSYVIVVFWNHIHNSYVDLQQSYRARRLFEKIKDDLVIVSSSWIVCKPRLFQQNKIWQFENMLYYGK